jgi:CheY-like chemotaxis protein
MKERAFTSACLRVDQVYRISILKSIEMNYNDIDILLVEDNLDDAKLTIRALKKSGFANKLHHARDGAESLDFIYCRGAYSSRGKIQNVKLVLLDLKMPKLSGIEVLTTLKSDPTTRSIPVVILTSSKEDPDIRECYALGVNSYIVKPVESENFFHAIKDLGFYWMLLNEPNTPA